MEYWTNRREEQGDAYVALGGDPDSFEAQRVAVTTMLADAVPAGGRVLDFGCGPGRFRGFLERESHEYVGVDLVPGLSTFDWDLETLPGGFDCVVALFVLQHITDEETFVHWVTQLHDCLKPGGVLIVLDHEPMEDPDPHMEPRGVLGVLDVAPWKGCKNQPTLYADHWFGTIFKAPAEKPEGPVPVFQQTDDGLIVEGGEMPEEIAINVESCGRDNEITRAGDTIDFQLDNGRWVYTIVGWSGQGTAVAQLEYSE